MLDSLTVFCLVLFPDESTVFGRLNVLKLVVSIVLFFY